MNRNRKLRKQMMSGLAVGMAAVMGAAPVYAATGEDAAVSKEETVYVNANADGSEDQITDHFVTADVCFFSCII